MGIPNPPNVRTDLAIGPADKTADTSTGSDCIRAALRGTLVAVGTDVAIGEGASVGVGGGELVALAFTIGDGAGSKVAVAATVFTLVSTVASRLDVAKGTGVYVGYSVYVGCGTGSALPPQATSSIRNAVENTKIMCLSFIPKPVAVFPVSYQNFSW